MALARVVTFDGVTDERIAQLRKEIGESGRPDEIPATEILVLHDREGQEVDHRRLLRQRGGLCEGRRRAERHAGGRYSGRPHFGHQVRRGDPDAGLASGMPAGLRTPAGRQSQHGELRAQPGDVVAVVDVDSFQCERHVPSGESVPRRGGAQITHRACRPGDAAVVVAVRIAEEADRYAEKPTQQGAGPAPCQLSFRCASKRSAPTIPGWVAARISRRWGRWSRTQAARASCWHWATAARCPRADLLPRPASARRPPAATWRG